MTQPGFNWSGDVNLPVRGKTPRVKHAGAMGAQVAAKTRGKLAEDYLRLLETQATVRGWSDYEAALTLGRLVSSICSTRNGLGDLIEETGGYEETPFRTKRTRYRRAR
jgi:hypothetical protein